MAMELEDLTTVQTPEGAELKLRLAGLGSRFIAGVADLAIMAVLTLALVIFTGGPGASNGFLEAGFYIGVFVIWLLYWILWELLAKGQTPGKRWSHLRVVRDGGAPVDLPASATRNLMRLIDGPLLLWIPTVIGIAVSPRNQRPGDVAAGTLVVRDRLAARVGRAVARPAAAGEPSRWDVSAVTVQELAVVRRFLERRDGLDRIARAQLAARLSEGLRPKVAGAPTGLGAEQFLEQLATIKAGGE
jgi:uncharacterized RDD family membrane protein YckC